MHTKKNYQNRWSLLEYERLIYWWRQLVPAIIGNKAVCPHQVVLLYVLARTCPTHIRLFNINITFVGAW